ncbi:MAG: hypothetical protein J6X33_07865 [Clostridiales bacterium]|nr:hypothetical protein [Clostridiales bacterium]
MGETMVKAKEDKDRKKEKQAVKSLSAEDQKELDRIDFLTLLAERRYM